MKCPSCSTKLEELKCENHTIDICPDCDGMWFDREEMQPFVEFILKENKIPDAKIELDKKPLNAYTINEPSKLCPRCEEKMIKYNYAYDSNIFLDRCPSCKGIWTDGKEIYQIAVHVKGNPALEAMGKAMAAKNTADDNGLGEALNILGIVGRFFLTGHRRRRWF